MQVVDRNGFIMWVNGVYLDCHNGKVSVAPEADCEEAKNALDRGERVALTVNGKIVSYVVPRDGGYHEELSPSED